MGQIKKLIAISLAVLLPLGIFGCNRTADAGSSSSQQGSSPSTVTKETFKPVTLRYATQHPTDNPVQKAAENIAAAVEKGTEGRVKIDIYPAQQLGDWTQIYDEVMMGTIDIGHISSPETYDVKAGSVILPYLASDYDEMKKVYAPNGYLFNQFTKIQGALGIHFFGFWCEGFGGVGTSKPVTNPASVTGDKGVLIRVPGLEVCRLPEEYRGYRTSTIPYSDVFISIQTGVVDGWFGGPPNLHYNSFRDVIKYYYQDNDFVETTQVLMNEKVFQSLLPEDQAVLTEVIQKELATCYDITKTEDAKYIQLMKDYGIKVTEFSKDELAAIADGVRNNVWPKFAESYGQEYMDGLLASYK